jgi:hypothetical protein
MDIHGSQYLVRPTEESKLDEINLMLMDKVNYLVKKMKTKVTSEIIYMKYDPNELKYVYICTYCNTSWKNHK